MGQLGQKEGTAFPQQRLLHMAVMLDTPVLWGPQGRICMAPMPCTVRALHQLHRYKPVRLDGSVCLHMQIGGESFGIVT